MLKGARRLLSRDWQSSARRALLALCLLRGSLAAAETIVDAGYAIATTRYPHGVLGDNIEHASLVITLGSGQTREFILPDDLVFEDTEPRLVDLDDDGLPEVITVESSQTLGARLAVYGSAGRIATTPHIGTRFRWLAPVGAFDLDGDGHMEIAVVDRPHLAKTLKVFRFKDGGLVPVAQMPGVTNHRIGERDIAGGIRDCDGKPEMILASADWAHLVAVTFENGSLVQRQIGTKTRREAFDRALDCAP
ncbi:VCBS repeat-containing protein [uncultured Roseobacter sp.]|uniref:FG-GAP repeat domain-containing protein n=1 Tax=uncultured Roseobacter sp. TaxID=114847 RepID=UPI00260B92BE|nr:VCBS repeat-containing protein [uncultured Roseobacter sp.]